ncbi:hypothetical protein EYF80_052152 [Liparis tanakae]|uniref:Uncharacterized protein n=1 Tax=Liparis tanakae TaxID=230148 RepID=A0A4Z2FBC0_9TELE|nr:hypothetical protein EYF80_052152 [Liparis tanakae]
MSNPGEPPIGMEMLMEGSRRAAGNGNAPAVGLQRKSTRDQALAPQPWVLICGRLWKGEGRGEEREKGYRGEPRDASPVWAEDPRGGLSPDDYASVGSVDPEPETYSLLKLKRLSVKKSDWASTPKKSNMENGEDGKAIIEWNMGGVDV